jgi:SAM-dependent methyltransferase
LQLCSGSEWAEALKRWIIPGAIGSEDLGDDVLEIGPGPGRATEILKEMTAHLTSLEIDPALAKSLAARMAGTNVAVVEGDATAMMFQPGRFSAAVSLTMLHHVPDQALQDRLFAEVARVLRPGGLFLGADSLDSDEFRRLHVDDICMPVDPARLSDRLVRAGFVAVTVEPNSYVVNFRARAAF